MSTRRSTVGLILFISSVLIHSFILTFYNGELIVHLSASLLQVICGAISFVWLWRAYRRISNPSQKYFWLLLSLGTLFSFTSVLSVFYFPITETLMKFLDLPYYLRLTGYLFFLGALVYKTNVISRRLIHNANTFNTLIFMSFAASISVQFLIQPVMDTSNLSFMATMPVVIYPITSWSILFVAIMLYQLSKYTKEKKNLQFVVAGFVILFFADSYYGAQLTLGIIEPGNLVVLGYVISFFLIGIAGRSAKESSSELTKIDDKFLQKIEVIFPYIIVIIFMLLVVDSYGWAYNPLSIGFTVTILMIIVRQVYVVNKNRKLIKEYRYLAYHDPLTGLRNRTSFKKGLQKLMIEAKDTNQSVAVLLMDLDRFKNVNDTLGHFIGDCILESVAKRLNESLGVYRIYRIGGDEFVIAVSNSSEQRCIEVSQKILETFSKPFTVKQHEIVVTPSIGISVYPQNGQTGDELLKNADAAMYRAKENGKNTFQFFNSELNEVMTRKVDLETELRKALELNQMTLAYQSKVELHTGKVTGMEVLLRWNHPILGFISPAEFIPVAEETGQIRKLGEWVLRTACKQNKHWHDNGYPNLSVSVNVSVGQLEHCTFTETVKEILDQTGLEPKFLDLEITESVMKNITEITGTLHQLREMGVTISIDDFGTGYSSLHILKELPIDTIKIDKSFIDGVTDSTSLSMVKTIIDMGINLNLNVVAEGIEEEHQARILSEHQCGFGQGYWFLKPTDSEKFEVYLKNDREGKIN
ncbi:putative bifunctional diguanylate cyclase/phosphodiesterase [Aquibacillus halophilus]|nr:EAL domain-containing protein [Aquibacillus halophilus]